MNTGIRVKYLWTRRLGAGLVLISLFFGSVAGCTPAGTPPVAQATPAPLSTPSPAASAEATLPSGWETRTGAASQGQCGYAISHPVDMQLTSQGTYSGILGTSASESDGPVPNFVYISVIPEGFQGEAGEIYNHDPVATETLLKMQVGESKPLHDNLNAAQGFTYTRLPDATLSNQSAQTYENNQPWEFPAGTKEIRYYLQGNGCTYLIGGYLNNTGSDQPGAIDEELFDRIMTTFQLRP
jgi:hypothetical protein